MSENPLNPRQKQVLTAIVDHYIVRAEPVSSKTLSQSVVLQASSATIRNTMGELEDMGFVEQPHASSGRLPTDLGYRTYVDKLMHPEPLRPEDRRQLDDVLADGESGEAAMMRATKTLADISQLLGLVIPPASGKAIFRKLSVVPVEEGRVALVLSSSEAELRSLVVDPGSETSIFRLEAVANRLNQELQGVPVSLLNTRLDPSPEKSISHEEAQALEILNRSILKLSRSRSGEDVFVYGAKNLLHRPDFSKMEDIGAVFELLDSKIALVHLLRQQSEHEGVHVSVGEERREDGSLFRSLSLVTSAFKADGGQGVVGVLGPKRMPYARLVPLIEYAARVLSRKRTGDGTGIQGDSENA